MNLCKHWINTMFTTDLKTIQPLQNTSEIELFISDTSSWFVKNKFQAICFILTHSHTTVT